MPLNLPKPTYGTPGPGNSIGKPIPMQKHVPGQASKPPTVMSTKPIPARPATNLGKPDPGKLRDAMIRPSDTITPIGEKERKYAATPKGSTNLGPATGSGPSSELYKATKPGNRSGLKAKPTIAMLATKRLKMRKGK